ncbi:MAG: BON domain-containing protein [Acidobacteriota bacterium]
MGRELDASEAALSRRCSGPGTISVAVSPSAFALQANQIMFKTCLSPKTYLSLLAMGLVGVLTACSSTTPKAADVSDGIRTSLAQAELKDVTVSQDLEKGVVTLGGHVESDAAKAHAEELAKVIAGSQVVANQIAVLPPGAEADAKRVNSSLDEGIVGNLDAALVQNKLHEGIEFAVKSQVVTVKGDVHSQNQRKQIEAIAAGIPNVSQVVNEIQVKTQKATSTK